MKENTELGTAVEIRGKGKAFDDYCKRVLSNKDVVCYILKKLIFDCKYRHDDLKNALSKEGIEDRLRIQYRR